MNRKMSGFFFLLSFVIAPAALFSGCSTANQDSPLSLIDASGKHSSDWLAVHGGDSQPDGSFCVDCHGYDLAGGITGISCSSESFDGFSCHANGPAFHPVDWLNKDASGDTWHAQAYQTGFQIRGLDCVDCHTPPSLDDPDGGKCVICHFTIDGGRTPGGWTHGLSGHSSWAGSTEETVCVNCHEVNNRFGNGPFCHNCHGVSSHDVPYLDHNTVVPTVDDFNSSCSACHSITGTSPASGAPVCVSCHTQGSPYVQTNCTSCHGRPPNTGKHYRHRSEASCSDCHQGAGTGSGLKHFYNGTVDVVFSASGFTYDGNRCTGTCHGEGHNYIW